MKKVLFSFFLLCSLLSAPFVYAKEGIEEEIEMIDNSVVIDRIGNNDIEVTLPSVIFTFSEIDVKLRFLNPNHTRLLVNKGKIDLIVNGEDKHIEFINGEASFKHRFDKSKTLTIFVEDFSYTNNVTAYPLWAILVPVAFIVLWIVAKMIRKK